MRKFLLISILAFTITNAYSQRFKIGVSAGMVQTDIDGTDTRDADDDFHKTGLTFGAFVNTKISLNSLLQMEINYAREGTTQPPDSNNNGYFKLDLNYVNVVLLVKHQLHIMIRKKPRDKFSIEGGFSAGSLINYNYNVGGYSYTLPPGYLNPVDVSLFIGVDYNFTQNFYLSIRYSNSVVPALNRSQVGIFYPYYSSFLKGDNMAYIFTLKYVFGTTESTTDKQPDQQQN